MDHIGRKVLGSKSSPTTTKNKEEVTKIEGKLGSKPSPTNKENMTWRRSLELQKYLAIKSERKNLEGLEHFLGIKAALS